MTSHLSEIVAAHVADLRRMAGLLDEYEQFDLTAAECRKAADELTAALQSLALSGAGEAVAVAVAWATITHGGDGVPLRVVSAKDKPGMKALRESGYTVRPLIYGDAQ